MRIDWEQIDRVIESIRDRLYEIILPTERAFIVAKYDLEELRELVRSRPWMSYRKYFPAIGESGLRSDQGWGWMLKRTKNKMFHFFADVHCTSKHTAACPPAPGRHTFVYMEAIRAECPD